MENTEAKNNYESSSICEIKKQVLDIQKASIKNTDYVDLDEIIKFLKKKYSFNINILNLDFEKFALDVGDESLKNADAFLFSYLNNNDAKFFISLNNRILKNNYFARFAIAHEIGHICLRHNKNGIHISTHISSDFDFNSCDNELENQANIFALLLLIPEFELDKKMRAIDVSFLSEKYRVPEEAVLKRKELIDKYGC